MIKKFYNSLDTLKTVTPPTRKEVIEMTIATFMITIIMALYFMGVDYVWNAVSNRFYEVMIINS